MQSSVIGEYYNIEQGKSPPEQSSLMLTTKFLISVSLMN